MSTRNAPCRCGSGKKFKVCCGRSPIKESFMDHKKNRILHADESPNGAPPPAMSAEAVRLRTADEQEFIAGPQCGQCRHWFKQPPARDPQTGAADLSVPPAGECRQQLCTAAVVANGPQGPVLLGFNSSYPNGIPPDFRACGAFEERKKALALVEA